MKYQLYTKGSKKNPWLYRLQYLNDLFLIRVDHWICIGRYVLRYESFSTIFSLDATDRSKIDLIAIFFALNLFPISFFANTFLNHRKKIKPGDVKHTHIFYILLILHTLVYSSTPVPSSFILHSNLPLSLMYSELVM